jgi:nucleotide-binding universal stress UspA family protein
MFKNIVFAYDGSTDCRNALEQGIAVAARFDAACHLLAVVPAPPVLAMVAGPLPDDLLEKETAGIQKILDLGLAHFRESGLNVTGAVRMWEDPTEAIADFACDIGADLVIVGHHKRSALNRWWCGSVGHSLLDNLPCSLFVAMPRDAEKQEA